MSLDFSALRRFFSTAGVQDASAIRRNNNKNKQMQGTQQQKAAGEMLHSLKTITQILSRLLKSFLPDQSLKQL